MQNFRNDILHAARDCLYNLEIHDMSSPIPNTNRFNPVRITPTTPKARPPNPGYETPTCQTLLRPVRPQDVNQQRLIPSVFLQVLSGERSSSGRGLRNSPVIGEVGDITEDYTLSIQCVLSDEYGAVVDANADPPEPKPISEQVNGFVADMDRCLNVHNLRPMMPDDIAVPDAYIAEWSVRPAMEGSNQEIVMANLVVTINFRR